MTDIDTSPIRRSAVYGAPPVDLVEVPAGAVQLSPLRPGAEAIESLPDDAALDEVVVAAPPGSIERRFVLAHALRILGPGGQLTVSAAKDKGGQRLRSELEAFGCDVAERFKSRQRICIVRRPDAPQGLSDAIEAGAPVTLEESGLLLAARDLLVEPRGSGNGDAVPPSPEAGREGRRSRRRARHPVLAALAFPSVEALTLVEIDRRAVEAARVNVVDPRAHFLWADARQTSLSDLDFVVSNPPFHAEGIEDRGLGQAFILAAGRMLRRSGLLFLVANRHMPYEEELRATFRSVTTVADEAGYKIFEARK